MTTVDDSLDSGATITVTRPAGGYRDYLRAYKIRVDGQVRGKIRQGGQLTITVPPGSHTIDARIAWTGSPAISFDLVAGQTAEFAVEPRDAAGAIEDLFGSTNWVNLRQVR